MSEDIDFDADDWVEEEEEENVEDLPDDFNDIDIEDLFNKNTASFQCLAQILISRSSLLRHPLYPFPPLVDPGLDDALHYVEPIVEIDNIGCEYYKNICKEYGIVPISRILRSLPTHELDLKYYGLTAKQVQALMQTLEFNEFVKELILQDNRLYPESSECLSNMMIANNTIEYMNLKACILRTGGAEQLASGLPHTIVLRELDLSFNELGDAGLLLLEPGLQHNISIVKLNLSHNRLEDEAAQALGRALITNNYIEDLDISWNCFYTAAGNKALFSALTTNKTIKILNISWNGIGTKEASAPIMNYLKKTVTLDHLDISNNRLSNESLKVVRNGLAKNRSLISVRIGNNPLTPSEALSVLKVFNSNDILEYMDIENVFVKKDFVPLWNRLVKKGKSISIGGVFSNYVIRGPDTLRMLFERAKLLAMKAKKKKAQRDFGHFILQMPQENITKQEFQTLVKKFKMKKVDKDVIAEIMSRFKAKQDKVNLVDMRESYMSYYPDTALPPPKPKKGKKGKKKDKKAEKQPPPVEAPLAEGQEPEAGQPPTEGEPPAEGEAAAVPTEAEAQTEQPTEAPTGEDQSQPVEGQEQPADSEMQQETQQVADDQQQPTESQEPPAENQEPPSESQEQPADVTGQEQGQETYTESEQTDTSQEAQHTIL